jgi:hypothetical protein
MGLATDDSPQLGVQPGGLNRSCGADMVGLRTNLNKDLLQAVVGLRLGWLFCQMESVRALFQYFFEP